MSAPTRGVDLRTHAAEASRAFEWAVEDVDDQELLEVVEKAAWALLVAAETVRRAQADEVRLGRRRGCNGQFIAGITSR